MTLFILESQVPGISTHLCWHLQLYLLYSQILYLAPSRFHDKRVQKVCGLRIFKPKDGFYIFVTLPLSIPPSF